uniref:Phospholipid-transporting ATPase n=1 Tax=Percolomonas cosmopolitus TaxID=63605 RepID=A0A7S1PJ75_9EUKA|mmetsp:Transcript_5843/g.22163  ORF Transcript_5843/g.22163 Transcript_5843/m.22163 type:complete len:1291 (+) Transcript_5843:407-4279(+)|eukprot:CAMPEP_0117441400 /NCGR_PEP_ID=MMETSP0759-20121206/3616_1 /TAXON_ID=63605 /ORGANISM="Percolomonas cosmopolitus, Strain WS" /LENGTH=1290 /DNA_ID=CAMNT_0005233255 /DNA_START=393 /DNA_END=4265 /DNA_ORIENTATION=+
MHQSLLIDDSDSQQPTSSGDNNTDSRNNNPSLDPPSHDPNFEDADEDDEENYQSLNAKSKTQQEQQGYGSAASRPTADNAPGSAVHSHARSQKKRQFQVNPTLFSSSTPSSSGGAKRRFKSNEVHTTRYSFISFVPKSLLIQFKRVANLYFLLIAILQVATPFSPTGRFSTIMPLTVVIIFSMLKDGFEDWKRRRGDWEVNHKKTEYYNYQANRWEKKMWRQVRVGDVLRVRDKEKFPCDLILLSSSDHLGLCYIETSQLDGETNYKIRRAHHETLRFHDEIELNSFACEVSCDPPNKDLYKFNGSMELMNVEFIGGSPGEAQRYDSINSEEDTMPQHGSTTKRISLSPTQILLRGSSLRNTKWAIGIAAYTGHESKLMKNQNRAPHKASQLEKKTNRFIFFILALLVTLVSVSTIGRLVEVTQYASSVWYMPMYKDRTYGFLSVVQEIFEGFVTFLILFNNLVPISLYVSMEVAKFVQGHFMSSDVKMYYEDEDIPCNVRNSSLNEELGQVDYIFSDKTGTLTQNKMEFLKFAVSGIPYGTGFTEIEQSNARRKGLTLVNDRPASWDPKSDFRFYDERISNANWAHQTNAKQLEDFFVLLAVCHTVIPETDRRTGKVVYNASSPDEAALVKAAAKLGVEFISRTPTELSISVLGEKRIMKLLNTLEFTSKRKRSSIIVRDQSGSLILYTKGADNVLYPLLNASSKRDADVTDDLLNIFADAGLRTLVCAKAQLDEAEYKSWNQRFEEASNLIFGREKRLEELSDEIERNLDLVGVTAIEDELQHGVPDTISELAKANIKLWVLTGDKKNTAINIGFACDLLNNDMGIIDLRGRNERDLNATLEKNMRVASYAQESKECLALVVEGSTLTTILDNRQLRSQFLALACECRSVICCRVSPSQKADIVKLVKNGKRKVTLAIGDGANDVPMIQAAHIGVGIAGEEGLQAANSADVSIGRFRFLKRLLLVHGRWSYRRVAKLVLYSFYKNIVLYLTQLWFVFFNWWSGTSIHDKWTVSTYNILFTSLPIMALAIFDRDVPDQIAETFPELYHQGHKDAFFSAPIFIGWLFNSLWHSAVCFIVPVYANYYGVFTFGAMQGQTLDMLSTGVMIYSAVLLTVTFKCVLETSSFTVIHFIGFVLSILIWFAFVFAYGWSWFLFKSYWFIFDELQEFAGEYRVLLTLNFWLTIVVTAAIANSRDFVWKCWKRIAYRKLYYEVQQHAKLKPRQEIMKYYPLEDSVPSLQKQLRIEYREMKKLFSDITGLKRYRGFAFSQSPNQAELVHDQAEGASDDDV